MNRKLVLIITGLLLLQGNARASVVLNEILADPASGLAGDANGDGTTSSSQDEFIELLNTGTVPVDLSFWTISDATQTRHVFPNGTIILGQEFLVIFGGGLPSVPGISFQTASTGTLSLNNTSEQISLFDQNGNLIDQISYGAEGGKDQSLVRFPEGSGNFVLHSTVSSSQALFSPGDETNIQNDDVVVTPESPAVITFLIGFLILCYHQRSKLLFSI